MAFLAPLMLIGLAAIAAPIIIHMLDRSKSVALDWPTLRFLRLARQQSARRSRLKNLLVLLARCLLLMLIAVAMAKPYTTEQTWNKPPDLPTTLVLVLDQSFSMGYQVSGQGERAQTLFDLAREEALRQLAELSVNDEAALILASDTATPVVERPTRDLEKIRQALREAKLSDRAGNLAPALALAYGIAQLDAPLDEVSNQPNSPATPPSPANSTASQVGRAQRAAWRQVVVLSDLQQQGWKGILESNLLDTVKTLAPTTIVDLAPPVSRNRYIRQINLKPQLDAGTLTFEIDLGFSQRLTTNSDASSAPASVDTAAGNTSGGGGTSGGGVTLWLDGKKMGEPVSPSPGSSRVTWRVPMPASGSWAGWVTVDEDRLPVDDRYFFALNVSSGQRVLMVDGQPSEVPSLSSTFYFNTALDIAVAGHESLTFERLSVDQFILQGQQAMSRVRGGTLILINVPQLDGPSLNRLEAHLRSGGNLWLILGQGINLDHYQRDWTMLPIAVERMMGDVNRSRTYAVVVEQTNHPMFQPALDFSATRFFQFVGSDPTRLAPGAAILASFSNGPPFIIEARSSSDLSTGDATSNDAQSSGQAARQGGRMLLMLGGLDEASSNLPFRRIFLPMVDRLLSYMTQARVDLRTLELGSPLRFVGPAQLDRQIISLVLPDETTVELTAALDPVSKQALAQFNQVTQAGVYRVRADEGFAAGGALAVNLDRRESVLTAVDPQEIKDAWGTRPLRILQPAAGWAGWNPDTAPRQETRRVEYWPWLLLAALGVFVAETLLANYFTRRKPIQPPPTTQYLEVRRGESGYREVA